MPKWHEYLQGQQNQSSWSGHGQTNELFSLGTVMQSYRLLSMWYSNNLSCMQT